MPTRPEYSLIASGVVSSFSATDYLFMLTGQTPAMVFGRSWQQQYHSADQPSRPNTLTNGDRVDVVPASQLPIVFVVARSSSFSQGQIRPANCSGRTVPEPDGSRSLQELELPSDAGDARAQGGQTDRRRPRPPSVSHDTSEPVLRGDPAALSALLRTDPTVPDAATISSSTFLPAGGHSGWSVQERPAQQQLPAFRFQHFFALPPTITHRRRGSALRGACGPKVTEYQVAVSRRLKELDGEEVTDARIPISIPVRSSPIRTFSSNLRLIGASHLGTFAAFRTQEL